MARSEVKTPFHRETILIPRKTQNIKYLLEIIRHFRHKKGFNIVYTADSDDAFFVIGFAGNCISYAQEGVAHLTPVIKNKGGYFGYYDQEKRTLYCRAASL